MLGRFKANDPSTARCPATTQTGVAASWVPRPGSNMNSFVGFKVPSFIFWIFWIFLRTLRFRFVKTQGVFATTLEWDKFQGSWKGSCIVQAGLLALVWISAFVYAQSKWSALYWVWSWQFHLAHARARFFRSLNTSDGTGNSEDGKTFCPRFLPICFAVLLRAEMVLTLNRWQHVNAKLTRAQAAGFVVGGLQDSHVKWTNCQKLTWQRRIMDHVDEDGSFSGLTCSWLVEIGSNDSEALVF